MLLTLRNDHKEHLSLLTGQSAQGNFRKGGKYLELRVLVDFCKLALDFLQKGPNNKLYNTAAQKLEVDPTDIENAVYGLLNLLLESCKHKLDEIDFRDSVLALGFSPEHQAVLSKFYDSKKDDILEILSSSGVEVPHYYNLEWRLEVQVASRCQLKQIRPLITMDLCLKDQPDNKPITKDETKKKHIILQTDPTNLVHMTEVLEEALNEARSRHVRRIQNTFK